MERWLYFNRALISVLTHILITLFMLQVDIIIQTDTGIIAFCSNKGQGSYSPVGWDCRVGPNAIPERTHVIYGLECYENLCDFWMDLTKFCTESQTWAHRDTHTKRHTDSHRNKSYKQIIITFLDKMFCKRDVSGQSLSGTTHFPKQDVSSTDVTQTVIDLERCFPNIRFAGQHIYQTKHYMK